MIIINTMDDIQKLRNQKKVDKHLVDELDKYFKELTHSFTGRNNWQTFTLKEEGSIIILEEKDNPHDLEEIGFPKEHGGLLSSYPEFADLLKIGEINYYKIVIVCSNSYGIVVYSRIGQFGDDFEKWVEKCLED